MPRTTALGVTALAVSLLSHTGSLDAGSPAARGARTSQTGWPSRVDAGTLLADVKTLVGFEGRQAATEGNRRARAFILQRFERLGLNPVAGVFEQRFALARRGGANADADPREGVNLMAAVEGTTARDRFVLVSAHYDHLGRRNGQLYPGADDNASGVAGMLATAAWFAGHRPASSILFVAFDAEEQELRGARHFVDNPPIDLKRIRAVVNLDMIGRGDANRIYVAGTAHYPQLKELVSDAAKGRTIEVAFGHDRAGAGPADDWTHASDHGPFHDADVPFLYFGVEDHPDYHKPTDTPDKIPLAFYDEAVEIVVDTVRRLSGAR
jgi:hypothetical protein